MAFVIEHLRGVGVQGPRFAAMREDIGGAAGQGIAEGGTGSAVHAFCGHDGEVEARRHIEEDLELVDFRAVFRCVDIEFNEAGHGFFAGLFADAQMGRLAAQWTNAAGLDAHAVEPAVFRASFAEPLRGEGRRDASRVEEVAQWALDAESIQ